jgi:predicted AlkP superfamily pyrophosphatase or phosphodiesterase
MTTMRHAFVTATWLVAWASSALAVPLPPRVVILSLDGAGARVVEHMAERGHMPNLSRLAATGVLADHARTHFVSQTAAGHAALWTGCFGNINGISGNQVPLLPRHAHTILDNQVGFSSLALVAEPIFVTAARAGKQVIALNATHTTPLTVYEPGGRFGAGTGDRLCILTGYAAKAKPSVTLHPQTPAKVASDWQGALPASEAPVLENTLTLGDRRYHVLLGADSDDPRSGYDTLWLYAKRDTRECLARLKPIQGSEPGQFSGPIRVEGDQHTFFGLVSLSPDGQHWQLYHTPLEGYTTNNKALKASIERQGGFFLRGGAALNYIRGDFGPTLVEGGSGRAEDVYLATVRLAIAQATRALAAAAEQPNWDLLLGYLPFPDEVLHLWHGYVTPGAAPYRRHLADALMPRVARVFENIDHLIGQVKHHTDPHTNLMVVSDHGMVPAAWDFYPNVILKQQGFLVLSPDGQVDLSRTQAMYSLTNGGYVIVNSQAFKGGIVPLAQVPTVAERAAKALRQVTVSSGLGPIGVVRQTLVNPTAAFTAQYGAGGELGGDVYLDLIPGYYLNPDVKAPHAFGKRGPNRSGAHMFDARRPELYAMFCAHGPAFGSGITVSEVRNVDVAPTAAHILGIPAPRQAQGRVPGEILRARRGTGYRLQAAPAR